MEDSACEEGAPSRSVVYSRNGSDFRVVAGRLESVAPDEVGSPVHHRQKCQLFYPQNKQRLTERLQMSLKFISTTL